jgi:serine protease Do/serine protease DegQ
LERESKEQGLGSGVIVSPNGFVLTNNHVIEGADELSIALPDGREFKATVIGADPKTDIAVVKIDSDNLPTLTLADSDKLRVGDVVFAIGNPLGIGQTVTMGIVSAKGRNSLGLIDGGQGYESFIQTDAAINMGNSGGALIDAKGRLIGINSAIISTTRGNIGIGLAIPVNLAASIMTSLTESGSVTRGYLGVSVDPVSPGVAETLGLGKDTKAVVVTVVSLGGPAEKAGLKRADAIISIQDKPVSSVQDLRLLISQMPPETEIAIKIVRDGKERTLQAKLGRLTNETIPNKFLPGVEVTRLSGELRHHLNITDRIDGLVITSVDHNSPYFDRLVPDMVITEVNRRPVTDIDTARQLLQPGRNLLFIYNRGVYRYLVIVTDPR